MTSTKIKIQLRKNRNKNQSKKQQKQPQIKQNNRRSQKLCRNHQLIKAKNKFKTKTLNISPETQIIIAEVTTKGEDTKIIITRILGPIRITTSTKSSSTTNQEVTTSKAQNMEIKSITNQKRLRIIVTVAVIQVSNPLQKNSKRSSL
jgi:hypothetical protein